MAKMYSHSIGQRTAEWNPLGTVWLSHQGKTPCSKSFQARILLAFGIKGCRVNRQNMRSLSNDGAKIQQTFTSFATHTSSMATPKMGHGPRRPTPYSIGKLQIHCSSSRVFNQVVRDQASSQHNSEAIRKFFWQNIICTFGVPKELTADNGKQFNSDLFKEFYHIIGMQVMFASVYHSQSTGQSKEQMG
jgi:hypothetical protein